MRRLRVFILILVALAVPFQGALALGSAQDTALEQCHEGDDGHDGNKVAGSHCGVCCTSAAITGASVLPSYSPSHGLIAVAPDLPALLPPPSGIDRPPRSR